MELNDASKNETMVILQKWKREEEYILKEWSDKAMCYKWLHLKSHESFKKLNARYTVPVIVISTVTGTANFAQNRIPDAYLNIFVMTVGALNLIAGIVSTVHQYLKIAEINEAHRVAYIAWDKFSRNIKIELSKNPNDRLSVMQMLKTCKEEYDRLEETSPPINQTIIDLFKKTFGDVQDLIKPDILGKLTPTMIYDRADHEGSHDDYDEIDKIIKENNRLIQDKKKLEKEKYKEDIQIHYLQNKGRMPTEEELTEYYTMI